MGVFDIIVIVVVAVAFAAVVGTAIYKKVKHKGGGCDCGCSDCSCCSGCNACKNRDPEKDN